MNAADHDFIYGDVFDWLKRLAKKGRKFDGIILDPPTFSQSKVGTFRAEKDYPKLVLETLPLLKTDGILFLSTNAARLGAEEFLASTRAVIRPERTVQEHYFPQPIDFPVSKREPAYLKTVWYRVGGS